MHFQKEVAAIRYLRGGTPTARALNVTLDHLQNSPRLNNTDNRQAIILLTDGK